MLALIIVSAVNAFADCSSTTTRCVPSEYSTIRAAIQAGGPGDAILVSDGTYAEDLDIGISGIAVCPDSNDDGMQDAGC